MNQIHRQPVTLRRDSRKRVVPYLGPTESTRLNNKAAVSRGRSRTSSTVAEIKQQSSACCDCIGTVIHHGTLRKEGKRDSTQQQSQEPKGEKIKKGGEDKQRLSTGHQAWTKKRPTGTGQQPRKIKTKKQNDPPARKREKKRGSRLK